MLWMIAFREFSTLMTFTLTQYRSGSASARRRFWTNAADGLFPVLPSLRHTQNVSPDDKRTVLRRTLDSLRETRDRLTTPARDKLLPDLPTHMRGNRGMRSCTHK